MATSLEDLRILQVVESMVDEIWQAVLTWNDFTKSTVGKQLTTAADSIGANIAESFGRFHYGDKLVFLYYARGSLFETKYWINRSLERKLLMPDQGQKYALQLNSIGRQLNTFASSLKSQQKEAKSSYTLREPIPEYITTVDEAPLFTDFELDWLAAIPAEGNLDQSPISNL